MLGEEAQKTCETYKPLVNHPNAWTKWLPSDPIPAHWYDDEAFRRLIFLYIARSRRPEGRDLPLGEFIRQFRGLPSTVKAKEIANLFTQIRRLSDFEAQEDLIGRLLLAMRENSRPVPAKALGLIGEAQFRRRLDDLYGEKRFW